MPADKLTRCPHCKAAFKVSDSQLAVANGRVRCGACMNVFDALAYSLGDAKDALQETPTADKELEQNLEQFAEAAPPHEELEDELIQDDPEEDADSESYSGKDPFDGELSSSFLELDSGQSKDSRDSFMDEAALAEETPDDESWATRMLEEENRTEPAPARTEQDKQADLPPEAPLTASREDSDRTSQNTDPFGYEQQSDNEHISFYYEEIDETPKRSKLASGLLIGFNCLLVLVLILLASWFHYEKLAKYPQIATLYEKACEQLGCQLPELSDITRIRSHNLVVRSHPTTKNALIIDAVITNEADFPQDFPDIALYFSDINNQTVAQRLIKPEQYLSTDILAWQELPSQQPIHISLEIVDPGKEAVNYTLKFFPRKEPDNQP
ncbi:MAG: DUF3426 domain-containing protein [Oleiphilus sp.]|nr:MAG: DUF3426 domain-containing protein [Oleiphilus sp.]